DPQRADDPLHPRRVSPRLLMRLLPRSLAAAALALVAAWPALPADSPSAAPAPIAWKKTVIEKVFRSEGIAIADVNHDGKPDLLVGDFWYEAPDWTPHEIRKPGSYGDGAASYSDCMLCFADDVNGDGWADQIVIGFPGKSAYWYENPKGASGHWKRHEIWPSSCNETPLFADLFGTGKPVLVMGWQPPGKETQGQMAWFAPGSDPTQHWEMHPISEPSGPETVVDGKKVPGKEAPGTRKFSHGLGVGDVNGDGRQDVICKDGWWEQPPEGKAAKAPWKFHPAKLGDPCAN